MRADAHPLWKSLTVSILSIWGSTLLCFFLLEFRQRLLFRTLGPSLTYLLLGLAFPLIAAPPVSRLVSRRSTKSFVVTFFVIFMVAVALMAVVLKIVDGLVGGYGAGFLAIWFFGSAMTHFLNSGSHFLRLGALLACWTFLGDFIGYNAREYIAGTGGVIAYASIYGLFFGSGLGTLLHHIQRDPDQL
jgi:hypothetical protein